MMKVHLHVQQILQQEQNVGSFFLQTDGIITDLRRQVKYILIPAQREPAKVGARGGIKQGKLLEKECAYIADFVYKVVETGEIVVEDTKGTRHISLTINTFYFAHNQ